MAERIAQLGALLDDARIRHCVSGDQAVSAYVEPEFPFDVDIVVTPEDGARAEELFAEAGALRRIGNFEFRIHLQTEPRYQPFVGRSHVGRVLGYEFRVAALDDVLQDKLWTVEDRQRAGSRRMRDLAHIMDLIETYPELRDRVPQHILARMVQ